MKTTNFNTKRLKIWSYSGNVLRWPETYSLGICVQTEYADQDGSFGLSAAPWINVSDNKVRKTKTGFIFFSYFLPIHCFLSSWCLVAQSCPTLCNPEDYSPPGSSVHGMLQSRILEWVDIYFSRGSSLPRGWTQPTEPPGKTFCLSLLKKKRFQSLKLIFVLFTAVKNLEKGSPKPIHGGRRQLLTCWACSRNTTE